MLIRFVVENFRSFRDETFLNLLPSRRIKRTGTKTRSPLPAAAIYGANASGKSNLVNAIGVARSLIVEGTRINQNLPHQPFKLKRASVNGSSMFEFTFLLNETVFTYGFKYNRREITEEWLFAKPNGRQEVLVFERISMDGRPILEFGRYLRGSVGSKLDQRLQFMALDLRSNQLFLTESVNRNLEPLRPVFDWFSEKLTVIFADSRFGSLEILAKDDKEFAQFMATRLKGFGTGIADIRTEELDFENYDFGLEESSEIRGMASETIRKNHILVLSEENGKQLCIVADKNNNPVILKLTTVHTDESNNLVQFELDEESDGTRRLMHLLPILHKTTGDRVFIVDEIDRRLHPNLTRAFLQSFLDRCEGEHRGQLMFTTHDASLLETGLLSNDEVWFAEKGDNGSSALRSLVEFKIRKGLKLENGYLKGRFGGVPKIRESFTLGAEECP